MTKVAF